MKSKLYICLSLVFIGLTGCATTASQMNSDTTLEKYNRAMFSFNNKVDKYIIRPVAKGYRAVTTEGIRRRVSNVFNNIEEPVSAINHVLQGEFVSSGKNLSRFVMNTTLGVVGIFDVATSLGLERDKTGFDETLSSWCVPDGPYVVLPIVGPSTPRSAFGFVADAYSSPSYWIASESGDDDAKTIYYGAAGLKYLNLMAQNVNMLESLEEGSIDYYEAIKSAYMQSRGKLKSCKLVSDGEDNVTSDYDFDMGDEMDYME